MNIIPSEVLVVGSVAYDTIVTPSETQERVLGGSASYGSFAASIFAPVRLVAVVGNDFEQQYIDEFKKKHIDIQGIKIDSNNTSFHWKGEYSPDFSSRTTLETHLNAFEFFNPTLPHPYLSSKFVLLGNILPSLQLSVLSQLSSPAFILSDSMDFWIKNNKTELLEVMKKTNLFVINDSEAILLSGEKNIFLAGQKILSMGCQSLIIKRGEYGSILFHEQGQFILPAFPVTRVVDPTGAGDTYSGALLGYLASINQTNFAAIKKAMAYATIIASLSVQDFSCKKLISCSTKDIDQIYHSFLRLISLN